MRSEIDEKQIEEMAELISIQLLDYEHSFRDCINAAEKLYKKNYRKIPEGARIILDNPNQQIVVLTEKEHEIAMRNQYDVGFNFGYEKGSKETVREIIEYLQDNGRKYETWYLISELKKQYGVEAKDE